MQPQNPLSKIPGSFVKPPEPQRRNPPPQQSPSVQPQQAAAPQPIQPQPEVATAESAPIENAPAESSRAEQLAKIKAQLEESVGASINEEDMKKYIFQGAFSKDLLIYKNGNIEMRGTFRTHTPTDSDKVDEEFFEFAAKNKHTDAGLANEKGLLNLSYVWTHIDGKPIGKDQKDRLARMRNMGALFVERASAKNGDFQLLLNIALEEGGLAKK